MSDLVGFVTKYNLENLHQHLEGKQLKHKLNSVSEGRSDAMVHKMAAICNIHCQHFFI